AGQVGQTLADYTTGRFTDNRDALSGDLLAVLRLLLQSAKEADVSLADAAYGNLIKIFDHWPVEKTYPSLFDVAFDDDEQLPRLIRMEIYEKTVSGNLY